MSSDACVTDSFARAKEAWSGSIRSPYPDGGASSGSYPPVRSLRHGRGRWQSRMRVDGLQCRGGGRIDPVCGSFSDVVAFLTDVRAALASGHRAAPRPRPKSANSRSELRLARSAKTASVPGSGIGTTPPRPVLKIQPSRPTVAMMPIGSEPLRPRKAHGPTSRHGAIATSRSASARISIVPAIWSSGSSTRSSHRRRVATRYDKLAANYLAFVQLASIRLWLRVNESAS